MTRKDYVKLAAALRHSHQISGSDPKTHRAYVEQVAEVLYRDNDRFDPHRFYEASGVGND